ncbi:MAG: ATP-binding protein [Chromatiales bacterium]|jgi:PAS domain S-box-containing protein
MDNKPRLKFSFTIVFMTMAMLVIVCLAQMQQTEKSMSIVVNESNDRIQKVSEMILYARERTIILHQLLLVDDPFVRDEMTQALQKYSSLFAENRISMINGRLSEEEQNLFNEQGLFTSIALPLQRRVVDLVFQEKQAQARQLLIEKVGPAQDDIFAVLKKLINFEREKAAHELELVKKSNEQALVINMLLGITGLLIVAFTGHYTITSIAGKEKQLSDERDMATDMFNFAPAGLLKLDCDGTILAANQAAADQLGCTKKQLERENFASIMPQLDTTGVCASGLDSLLNESGQDVQLKKLDGSLIPAVVNLHILKDRQIVLVSLNDVSEERKAEQERLESIRFVQQAESAAAAAENANRLKSEFLANMSHEMRTPLHAIRSFTQLANKLNKDNGKMHRYFENILSSSQRLGRLVNDLLDLSKLEAGKMEMHIDRNDVVSTVHNVAAELESLLEKKSLQLEIDAPAELEADFDQDTMVQVLVNVLSNAIKFSPENGMVRLAVEAIPYERHGKRREVLTLTVTDQGAGIPESELDLVFDKFAQSSNTDNKAGGTGLGLAICREIMLAHNGGIKALKPGPDENIGAKIEICLPRYAEAEAESVVTEMKQYRSSSVG